MKTDSDPDSKRPAGGPESRQSEDGTEESSEGDAVFLFVDKAMGFLAAAGLGYLALRHLPGAFWIAIGLVVGGVGVRMLCRAL